MKLNLIIVSSEQFGYHIDTYYYARYLRNELQVHYICWDHGLPRVELNGVNVRYVARQGNIARVLRFLESVRACLRQVEPGSGRVIFISYMKLVSSILRLRFSDEIFILDIRTGDVSAFAATRYLKDILMRAEAILFKNVAVISDGLAVRLRLAHRAYILPLGADVICSGDRRFDLVRLIYVGTLHNRNIHKAVEGFAGFLDRSARGGRLTIIGGTSGTEVNDLRRLVTTLGIQSSVEILGAVPHDELATHFREHNIGLSFIPMTSYYDVQPPTKTFEYLMSGMPVIATSTRENRRIIDAQNGILIQDSSRGVCDGLMQIERNLSNFESDVIRNSARLHQWPRIITRFRSYIESCANRC